MAQQGIDLAQQINAMPEADKQALLEGIGSSLGGVLVNLLKSWITDPANQKVLTDLLLQVITSLFKK